MNSVNGVERMRKLGKQDEHSVGADRMVVRPVICQDVQR